ncbi:MAG: DNA cytosine methyltransferase [Planctomycetes bacterium]|nr:DNA cytosine methyltransferase [Planctomycetota bacterium]
MRVLIACEYSGTVRDAFIAMGHDAISCDLLPTDKPGPHYQGDVFDIINDGFDLMIAHPPCTYLSNAGARHLYKGGEGKLNLERYETGMQAKAFFMALYNSGIPRIAIENPIPSRVFELPPYAQIIQPWMFGHPYQKRTCLWLKNLPALQATDIVSERQSSKVPVNWFNKGGKDRQHERARTFQGIANAMAEQWGNP